MPVVRVSRGKFEPEATQAVRAALEGGKTTLVPAIRALSGLLHYYVGIDSKTNTMVNVSVWESEAAAEQMSTLQAMLDQRDGFIASGVVFDPIANYEPLWDIMP